MGGAPSVHKKGWVLVADGEAFPQERARSSRRCSWCWQRALFAWGRPGEILSDHQHGHSAGRSKMQLIRENSFIQRQVNNLIHAGEPLSKRQVSEWQELENKAGKRQNYSPHTQKDSQRKTHTDTKASSHRKTHTDTEKLT